ncbi:hypothetical protein RUM43_003320 [Polyplax serrata]|uniref:RH2 domain-containing protein n=1 Tax=Polyplax serrata TaxID=468196 RepID=A0AAN8PED1_POLSC
MAQRRAIERKEQYRQVRAHVRKDGDRLQAYGWSLPGKMNPNAVHETGNRSHIPVPVPIYCQPLAVSDPSMKVWCAAGVNLTGGKTKDGGSIVGASVFYSKTDSPEKETEALPSDDSEPHITELEEELKEAKKIREESETLEQRLSSLVWICTSSKNESRVTVIDATNPSNILETFTASSSLILCIASVPGAIEADYGDDNESNNNIIIEDKTTDSNAADTENNDENSNLGKISCVACESVTDQKEESKTENEGNSVLPEKMSSVMPTIWIGAHGGSLYVHSAIGQWSKCIHSVKMPDSVSCIVHSNGRVLVALANGLVAVFRRGSDAQWCMDNYHTVHLGSPDNAVKCMAVVHNTVWCGYKNKIHVLDPVSLVLKKSLEAHPRKESQVRQLAWLGDGVWVSIRLDSTLRLFHAYTYQHLQDVDIEPYVSKMLGTGKLGFSFVRITALLISTSRLWIGTGNGVIISVPLSENTSGVVNPGSVVKGPGAVVRVYTDSTSDKVLPGSFIPFCSMAQAQLSFHGHREAVKFFIAVPGTKPGVTNTNMLVMSGGEGYIDFRLGDTSDEESNPAKERNMNDESSNYDYSRDRKGDFGHLIIWQVPIIT